MTIVNPSNSIKKILEISNINRNIVMRSEWNGKKQFEIRNKGYSWKCSCC
jgi:hypothetical protein